MELSAVAISLVENFYPILDMKIIAFLERFQREGVNPLTNCLGFTTSSLRKLSASTLAQTPTPPLCPELLRNKWTCMHIGR